MPKIAQIRRYHNACFFVLLFDQNTMGSGLSKPITKTMSMISAAPKKYLAIDLTTPFMYLNL